MLTDERYKQLMNDVGLPNSRSLLQALKQCAMEAALSERAVMAKAMHGMAGVGIDIVSKMRSLESDHGPDGWPAITMGQVSALCDEIDRLRAQLKVVQEQEPVGYVVIGQGISFYRTTKEEAEHQANTLEWRDDKEPVIHPVYIQPQPAQAAAIPEDIEILIAEVKQQFMWRMEDSECGGDEIAESWNTTELRIRSRLSSASKKPE